MGLAHACSDYYKLKIWWYDKPERISSLIFSAMRVLSTACVLPQNTIGTATILQYVILRRCPLPLIWSGDAENEIRISCVLLHDHVQSYCSTANSSCVLQYDWICDVRMCVLALMYVHVHVYQSTTTPCTVEPSMGTLLGLC